MYSDNKLYDNGGIKPGGISFRPYKSIPLESGGDLAIINTELDVVWKLISFQSRERLRREE